LIIPSAINL